MKSIKYQINKEITIRKGLVGNEIQILVGQGSARKELLFNSPNLIKMLFELQTPKTNTEILENLKNKVNLDEENANAIFKKLLQECILVEQNESVLVDGLARQWDEWGWRDALDYHLATRNMIWKHFPDYTRDEPPIRTYVNGQPIIPDREKPINKKPNENWLQTKLPKRSGKLQSISYNDALYKRETFRNFIEAQVSLEDFSDLFSYTAEPISYGSGLFRPTPIQTYSLGNFFSLYPVVINVDSVQQGAYFYDGKHHSIWKISEGNYAQDLIRLAQEQTFIKNVSFGIFVSLHWDQYMWKYRFSRAYRVALFEIASAVQTLLIIAAGLGLKTFITPAIADSEVAKLLQIKDMFVECPMYVIGVGKG